MHACMHAYIHIHTYMHTYMHVIHCYSFALWTRVDVGERRMSMVAHLDRRVAAALESTGTTYNYPTRAVSRRTKFVVVVLSFLLLPPISTCPASSAMFHFSRNSCWRNPMRLRGGAMRAAERVSEVHEGGHGSERCKADAANAGMSRALGESWKQLDPIVSEYICKVLADATQGEERDLASFLPSISSLLDAHGDPTPQTLNPKP